MILCVLFSCQPTEIDLRYDCVGYNCIENTQGEGMSLEECKYVCQPKPNAQDVMVTVFVYENCPIAQYMCGPLRNSYRYFCDTLNQGFIFRGFSPNAFSTQESLADFVMKYDIPFTVSRDYNEIDGEPGLYTQNYLPIVTPEVFIELNGELLYKGMIDNSYQSLGQWTPPTEHYLIDILNQLVNEEEIVYFETEAVGCFINY